MLPISRILSLLAGALIGAVILQKKEDAPAGSPWRTELEELQKRFTQHLSAQDSRMEGLRQQFEVMVADLAAKPDGSVTDLTAQLAELQPKIEAMARQLAQTPDNRLDELAARIGQLQPKIEAVAAELAPKFDRRINELAAQVDGLRQTVGAQEQKLQATNRIVIAIEEMLSSKMAEFEKRLEAQGRTLEAMNSSIAQSDELLERMLDLVRTATVSAGEPREPVATVSGGSEIRELQL